MISLSFFTSSNVNIIELLKSKINKYYSINCQDTILDLLKTLKREFFTNNIHYEYYKRYIIPKLSRVENSKVYIRKTPWGKYRAQYKLLITTTENYITLTFIETLKNNHEEYAKSRSTYILGLNSDKKLFINKIHNPILINAEKLENNKIIIQEKNDSEIHSILGYEIDTADKEEIIINSELVELEVKCYRVQGEILICVEKIENIEKEIMRQIIVETQRLLRTLAIELIYKLLVNIGLNPVLERMGDRIVIVIRGTARTYGKAHEYAEILEKTIIKELGYTEYYKKEYYNTHCVKNKNSEICFCAGVRRRAFGQQYVDIEINVTEVNNEEIMNKLISDIREQLKTLKRENHVEILGNHIVELENTISMNITYTPPRELQPLIDHITITRNINRYYVDRDSTITVKHGEHGITRVKFTREYLVFLTTTRVHPDYTEEINRIVLDTLEKNTK